MNIYYASEAADPGLKHVALRDVVAFILFLFTLASLLGISLETEGLVDGFGCRTVNGLLFLIPPYTLGARS